MNQLDRIGTFCEKCNNVVCRCKAKFKCEYCQRPMDVSALAYKSNKYCNYCFYDRANKKHIEEARLNTFEFMGDSIKLKEDKTIKEIFAKNFNGKVEDISNWGFTHSSLRAMAQYSEQVANRRAVQFAEFLKSDYEFFDDSQNDRILWELAGTKQRYTTEELLKEFLTQLTLINK